MVRHDYKMFNATAKNSMHRDLMHKPIFCINRAFLHWRTKFKLCKPYPAPLKLVLRHHRYLGPKLGIKALWWGLNGSIQFSEVKHQIEDPEDLSEIKCKGSRTTRVFSTAAVCFSSSEDKTPMQFWLCIVSLKFPTLTTVLQDHEHLLHK